MLFFFFSRRRRHTRSYGDWSSDVCSSDLLAVQRVGDVLDRTQEKVAEMTARLHRAGAVVAPLWNVVEMLDRVDDLRLRAELRRGPLAVNPYVFCGDFCHYSGPP